MTQKNAMKGPKPVTAESGLSAERAVYNRRPTPECEGIELSRV